MFFSRIGPVCHPLEFWSYYIKNFDSAWFDGTWTMFNSKSSMYEWSMCDGTWSMCDGTWSMLDGTWSMLDGTWSMLNGTWSMLADTQSNWLKRNRASSFAYLIVKLRKKYVPFLYLNRFWHNCKKRHFCAMFFFCSLSNLRKTMSISL